MTRKKLHQVTHSINTGDAVSDHVFLIRRWLREMGYESDIYAYEVDDSLGDEVLTFDINQLRSEKAVVFHHAHGNERQTLELQEATPGCYVVKFPARWSGIWELDLEAKLENDCFLLNENKEIRFPATNQPKVLSR